MPYDSTWTPLCDVHEPQKKKDKPGSSPDCGTGAKFDLPAHFIPQVRRRFREYEQARKRISERAAANLPPRNVAPILEVDYLAVVAANVHRERDSMVPVIC